MIALVAATLLAPSPAAVDGQGVEIVSLGSTGAQGDGGSGRPSLSADGTKMLFLSHSTDLVPGDTNGRSDVFLRDLETGQVTLVSVSTAGVQGNRQCFDLHLSGDGRVAAWTTASTTLVANDTNNVNDVFVRDLATGVTERVSVSSTGAQANFHCENPYLNHDGSVVVFGARASNLVQGDTNFSSDIFVHTRSTGVTELVTQSTSGVISNNDSDEPQVSADGRYVVYSSFASNLVPGDTNVANDVFLRDRTLGTTTLVSVDSTGALANDGSGCPRITPDGEWIAFASGATNLVANDSNTADDVFLVRRTTGAVTLVSTNGDGAQSVGLCTSPWMSDDARYVVFAAVSDDLDPGDQNGVFDVYRKDLWSGALERVSIGPGGVEDDFGAGRPRLTADGSQVFYASNSTTFVSPDLNGVEADIYRATCEEIAEVHCTSAANSTGSIGALAALGSASIGVNDFVLLAQGVPAGSVLFFHGDDEASSPLGNGVLCVGGHIRRLGVSTAPSQGIATLRINLSPILWQPSTQYFQAWFRDQAAGGARTNLTSGIRVDLVP